MAKVKVYELAKELGMESKDVLRQLSKMGCELKNHICVVEDALADRVR